MTVWQQEVHVTVTTSAWMSGRYVHAGPEIIVAIAANLENFLTLAEKTEKKFFKHLLHVINAILI